MASQETQTLIDAAFARVADVERERTESELSSIRDRLDCVQKDLEARLLSFKTAFASIVMQGAPLDAIVEGGCIAGIFPFTKREDGRFKTPCGDNVWEGDLSTEMKNAVVERMFAGAGPRGLSRGAYELVFYVRKKKE